MRWAAVLAALAAAAFVIWNSRDQRAEPSRVAERSTRTEAPAMSTPTAASMTPAATPATRAPPAPLPAADTPLLQMFDQLEARARAGDVRAACRLAAEADYCVRHPPDDPMLEMVETAVARNDASRPQEIAAIAAIEDEQARARRVCPGIPAARLADASWRYSLQVAQAGDAWFAARYAHGGHLDRRTFLEHPQPWEAYRRNAVPLLMRAAAQGEPRALWQLWRIHAGAQDLPGMANAIVRDPHLARVYAHALRAISAGEMQASVDRWLEETRAAADAATWAAAEREGLELARRQYAQAAPFDPRRGVIGALDPARCEALSAP